MTELNLRTMTRQYAARGTIAITYSILSSGHSNIYFLTGLTELIGHNYTHLSVLYDDRQKVIAVRFEKEPGDNTYKLMRKQKKNTERGQLFISSQNVGQRLKRYGYPRRTPIKVEQYKDDPTTWVLLKEAKKDV